MGMPRVLKHFSTFIDGTSYVGEVEEITLPKLTRKMEDYRAGGMFAPVKSDQGMEAMELELTSGGWLRDILGQWGNTKHNGVLLRFAGALQNDDTGGWDALEVVVRGRWEEIDPGSAKAGEKTEFKAKMAVSYYKLVWNGATLIELDPVAGIENVGGVDMLASVRQILGI